MSDDLHFGVLRVLTCDDPEEVTAHGRVLESTFSDVTTTSECIPDHPNGLPDVEAEKDALPQIETLGHTLADKDIDALLISCALDPAVEKLDASLSIPVIGAGRSVAAAALARGEQVGTLTLESGTPPAVETLLADRHQAEAAVSGAEQTNYLTTERGRAAIVEAVDQLEEDDCDVIAASCTGLTTSRVLPEVKSCTNIPVVDPVCSMGAIAYNATYH